jgi:2-keto-3-deoxy-L-rhamnonate aldolase RhmA
MAPDAMMIPMVNTRDEAKRLVAELTFAPTGRRSYGGRRVVDVHTRDFHLKKPPVLMMQIETLEAVDNVEAIAETEGVDCLFYGPDDMRVQCGLPMTTGVFEDDRLLAGLKRTAEAARKAGKWCGTVSPDPAGFQKCLDMGYQVLVAGADIGFLRTSAARQLAMVQEIFGKVGGKTPVPGGAAGIY